MMEPFSPSDRLQPMPPTVAELLRAMSIDHANGARLAQTYKQWIADKAPGRPDGPPLAMSPAQVAGWRDYELRRFVKALDTLSEAGERMMTVR